MMNLSSKTRTMAHVSLWLFVCCVISSCWRQDPIESNFTVAGSQRPSWYENTYGISEEDIEIAFDIHTSGLVDVIIRSTSPRKRTLEKMVGRYENVASPTITIVDGRISNYPGYFRVTVDGSSDIYVQRAPEPYVYVATELESEKVEQIP